MAIAKSTGTVGRAFLGECGAKVHLEVFNFIRSPTHTAKHRSNKRGT